MTTQKVYIDLYNEYESVIRSTCGELLNAPRQAAFDAFVRLGFPTTSMEAYRDCDLNPILETDYGMNLHQFDIPVNPQQVFSCEVPNLSTCLYFLINDRFYQGDKQNKLPEGVLCGSLNELGKTHQALLEPYFASMSASSEDGMVQFNGGFVQDGYVLYVPANVHLDKPIQVINVLKAPEDMMVQRRILVILEKGAHARLLMCDHNLSENRMMANQVAEIFVGKSANLEYYELEMNNAATTRVSNTFVQMEAASSLRMNQVVLSNGFTRNNATVRLMGEGAEANMSGVVLGERNQFTDNHVLVDHAVPHCTSNQLYKYVLDDTSNGVFGGSILVRGDAQKTKANQSNKNLCSHGARMRARPQLEIYADDVVCSHGSATGQMDENALFYMRTRGISVEEARLLLKYAFTTDVIDTISLDPLRDRMRMLVEKRFRGELVSCAGCSAANCR